MRTLDIIYFYLILKTYFIAIILNIFERNIKNVSFVSLERENIYVQDVLIKWMSV